MEIPKNIKEIFESEKYHELATASKDGIPNISFIGAKYLQEDGTIVLIDNYMKKTLENILENPKVAILVRKDKEAYQLKGTCRYLNVGKEYEEAREWMKAKGDKYPTKGVLFVKVEEIFYSTANAMAGQKI